LTLLVIQFDHGPLGIGLEFHFIFFSTPANSCSRKQVITVSLGNVSVTVFIVIIPAAAVVGVVIVVVSGAGGFEFVVFSSVLKVIPMFFVLVLKSTQYGDYC
jgi:hypothetical protein